MEKPVRLAARCLQGAAFLMGAVGFNPLLAQPPESSGSGVGRQTVAFVCLITGALLTAASIWSRVGRTRNWRGVWLIGAWVAGGLGGVSSARYLTDFKRWTYEFPEDPPRVYVGGTEYTQDAREYLRTNAVETPELVANYGGPQHEERVWTGSSLRKARSWLVGEYAVATLTLCIAIFCAVESVMRSLALPVVGIEALRPASAGTSGRPPGPRIFVSYSHKDLALLSEFKKMLAPAIRNGAVDLWDDSRIETGTDWREQIAEALASARVAVLLVTHHFLASEFIVSNELTPLLERSRSGGTVIFWIHVSPAMYEQTMIERFQAAHDVSKPLSGLTRPKRLEAWREICTRLVRIAREAEDHTV